MTELERTDRPLQRHLALLPPSARRDLLRVLASPSEVRADLIRQMCERQGTRDLAELLIDLEAEPEMRLQMIEALRSRSRDRDQ